MPECRVCKRQINKKEDDWIMPSKNYYYHKKCYENWKKVEPASDEEYKDLIYDFIKRDLKKDYDFWVCEAQREKFLKQKMTNKGILFALKYFYEVKHGDWEKGHGGIGIVPFIYNDACAYWAARERQAEGTIAEIERQMIAASQRTERVVRKKEIKPRKTVISLDAIAEMEDEE